MKITRRFLLAGASAAALCGPAIARGVATRVGSVDPVPARFVRLRPSIFADAFAANRRYLLDLDPERLLHNFYRSAGLAAPKPVYGGWEAMGIAGHSMGHWLSACALVVGNTGDAAVAAKLDHALAEMARIQRAHGDGYVGGTTVERDGRTVDGKIVFEELRRGDIRSNGFDLNGGWVPLYTWHKVQAGLIDAHVLARNPRAMPVLLGMAGYLAGVLEPLDDARMQRVLAAEHGGLNEAYADTYALTGDERWLRLARRIHHRKVLDPLTAGEDRLAGLHANTQIPKLIGLARLHELTGDPVLAKAPRFFHERVTRHHSYVIGGNSEREHFGEPDRIANRITEATCEACNSYNMLKLTRHLYRWQPDARWFDQYERIQLNHIMAHQHPGSGRFVYFMPLAAGARRVFSDPENSFWCCVGSGMESHAKHADSIWWSDAATLYLNLFIASDLDWPERGLALTLDTAMPARGQATITVRRAPRREQTIAIRVPGWATGHRIAVNGAPADVRLDAGYARLTRRWKPGDRVTIDLPMALKAEPTPGDPTLVAFTHGPLVMAADLGSADTQYEGVGPALVVADRAEAALRASGEGYRATGALGEPLRFVPFFAQYDRRSAVYFPTFSAAAWAERRPGYVRAQQAAQALARRTTDIIHLGEMQPERDHRFASERSEVVNWGGRSARRLRPGESMRMTLDRPGGAAVLRVLAGQGDSGRGRTISVGGQVLGAGTPAADAPDGFRATDYPVPAAAAGAVEVIVTARDGEAVLYEMRMMAAIAASA